MSAPVVEVQQGKLSGVIRDNVIGGQYFSFRGVPYAEPPIGELRFKEAQPLKRWSGVRDALDDSKRSMQYNFFSNTYEGGEDCLYLNIATTSLTEKRPVIVLIHGGGFLMLSNTYTIFGPDYLLKKDIVFVAINYRLGILGFLNMEHEECPGNQGLKDQIAALKWIQENITVFGGDPKNVTIYGQSAGGASVHALCLSTEVKGLFHKAIISSGAMSCPWAFISSNKEEGYTLAEALGKKCTNSVEVIEFLRTIPAIILIEKSTTLKEEDIRNYIYKLVPTLDNASSNPILSSSINEMLQNGINIPLLIGYNSHEGISFINQGVPIFVEGIDNNFTSAIAKMYHLSDIEKFSKFANAVRKFYFGEDEINEGKINELVQFIGDMMFVNNIHRAVDIQLQKDTPTYFYKFSYRPNYEGLKKIFNKKIEDVYEYFLNGANHTDELGCLFFSEALNEKVQEGTRDHLAMERMTIMWTNFAKTGDPTPFIDEIITTKWLRVDKNKKNYLEINDNLTLGQNPDAQMWEMWKQFF